MGGVGFGAGAALSASCSLDSLKPVNIGANTFVYAADGSLLGSIPADRNREPVDLRQMSGWLPKATVAVEDKRFYEHGGVDYVGILRALWTDVGAGRVVEGGSTISQQLVRNMYVGREQTFERKIKEACLAIKLSDRWSKSKILQTYLNTVYYGNHAYGVEAAAQTYFSRRAANLNLAQAALLAGLPQAPSIYDPLHNPKAALVRRGEVLRSMLADDTITPRQFRWAMHRPLHLKPGEIYTRIKQPYFFSYVIDELESVYGANTVREGGLRVYTTIEPKLQVAANGAIRQTLDEPNDPAAAIVSVQPGTGFIRAMTAVIPGNAHNQFNLTSQSARQAGSTFKTFVLAAAIEKGMDPDATYYTSAPFTCTTGPWCEDDYKAGKPWTVSTYDHTYAGTISVTSATLRSDNTVYAQLTLDVGPDVVWRMAKRLGVHLTQKPVASIGLGALSVSPLDMAAAYATFADGGIYARPTAIRKVILPNGKIDKTWSKPVTKRVLSQGVAYEVTHVLGLNAQYGTGYGLGRRHPPERRQDGDDERPCRRLVRRIHARFLDGGLDGLSARRDPDARCPRPGGRRRDLPRSDLASLHGAGREEPAGAAVPDAERLPDLHLLPEGLLGLPRRADDTDHHHHDDHHHTTTTAKAVPSKVPDEENPTRGTVPSTPAPAPSPGGGARIVP